MTEFSWIVSIYYYVSSFRFKLIQADMECLFFLFNNDGKNTWIDWLCFKSNLLTLILFILKYLRDNLIKERFRLLHLLAGNS